MYYLLIFYPSGRIAISDKQFSSVKAAAERGMMSLKRGAERFEVWQQMQMPGIAI